MKVYYIASKKYKNVVYLHPDKLQVEMYWKNERLDDKYYEIKETKSETALGWIQGKIDRSILIKELEANYGK